MTKRLYIGTDINIELPKPDRRTKRGFLFIDNEVPDIPDARVFDPRKHTINLVDGMDYPRACRFVDGLLGLMPGGETTLTKEAAQFIILVALLDEPKTLVGLIEPSKDPMREKARQMIDRLMVSPVLRRVFAGKTNFSLDTKSPILARVNRSELTRFDADAITLFLMALYPGQIIAPRFGACARDAHIDLIEQDRLDAGVTHLGQLPDKLRAAVMLVADKRPSGALYDDAVELARHAGLTPNTIEFNDEVAAAMRSPA